MIVLAVVALTLIANDASVANRVHGNLVLLNDNGAWCWYQDGRAIVDEQANNLLPARQDAAQGAEARQFAPNTQVEVTRDARTLYRTYVGRAEVDAGDSVAVFVDSDPQASQRPTVYDGIG